MFGFFSKKKIAKHKALVLMYHRIGESKIDPWQLAVSPFHFEKQLEILIKKFSISSIAELLSQMSEGSVKKNTICLSFDDGYLDNYTVAKPLLEQYNCPATFFITTEYLEQGKIFWWEELQSILLEANTLPKTINLEISGNIFVYDLAEEYELSTQTLTQHLSWKWPQPAPTKRAQIYLEIWKKLKPLCLPEIERVLYSLKQNVLPTLARNSMHIPMTKENLKKLATNPLFSIGIHTVTHLSLPAHDPYIQKDEILKCKLSLENLCNVQVNSIAYPYGDYNDSTLAAANEINLKAGFTTREQSITDKSNFLSLGRVMSINWNEKLFANILLDKLKN